uniref:SAM domain-containing protein n=1 Tax=Glossina brevipalpis TaxID=37001 RepID=A0A1A9WM87_9MUSC
MLACTSFQLFSAANKQQPGQQAIYETSNKRKKRKRQKHQETAAAELIHTAANDGNGVVTMNRQVTQLKANQVVLRDQFICNCLPLLRHCSQCGDLISTDLPEEKKNTAFGSPTTNYLSELKATREREEKVDLREHFRDQCIDGSGLPLLTEDHLVNSLGMKLGPALKLRSALAKKLGGPCPCVACLKPEL